MEFNLTSIHITYREDDKHQPEPSPIHGEMRIEATTTHRPTGTSAQPTQPAKRGVTRERLTIYDGSYSLADLTVVVKCEATGSTLRRKIHSVHAAAPPPAAATASQKEMLQIILESHRGGLHFSEQGSSTPAAVLSVCVLAAFAAANRTLSPSRCCLS